MVGRWERDVEYSAWILPTLALALVTTVIIVGIWLFFEGPGSMTVDKEDESSSLEDTDKWVEKRLEELKSSAAAGSDDKQGYVELASPLREQPLPPAVAPQPRKPFLEALRESERLLTQGNLDEARALLVEPDGFPDYDSSYETRYQSLLGVIALRMGDAPEAVSHFIRARNASPRDLSTILNLAEALREAGMIRLTEAALLDALELSPDGLIPNVRYRYFLIATGRRDQVVEEIRSVSEAERNQTDVLAVAAALHAQAGSFDKVEKVMERIQSQTDEATMVLLFSDPIFRSMASTESNPQ